MPSIVPRRIPQADHHGLKRQQEFLLRTRSLTGQLPALPSPPPPPAFGLCPQPPPCCAEQPTPLLGACTPPASHGSTVGACRACTALSSPSASAASPQRCPLAKPSRPTACSEMRITPATPAARLGASGSVLTCLQHRQHQRFHGDAARMTCPSIRASDQKESLLQASIATTASLAACSLMNSTWCAESVCTVPCTV